MDKAELLTCSAIPQAVCEHTCVSKKHLQFDAQARAAIQSGDAQTGQGHLWEKFPSPEESPILMRPRASLRHFAAPKAKPAFWAELRCKINTESKYYNCMQS